MIPERLEKRFRSSAVDEPSKCGFPSGRKEKYAMDESVKEIKVRLASAFQLSRQAHSPGNPRLGSRSRTHVNIQQTIAYKILKMVECEIKTEGKRNRTKREISMELGLLSGGTKHSTETVRALHETIIALRAALECSRKELSELRRVKNKRNCDGVRNPPPMEGFCEGTDHGARGGAEEIANGSAGTDGKPDSGAESEDIDDIELVFTTGDKDSDSGAMHEDMIPIFDEKKTETNTVLVETDISKCGIVDENETVSGSRRNTLPDPLPYRPIIHREIIAAARASRSSPSKVRLVPDSSRQETGAQTDITAVPAVWKSETYLVQKISYNLTTLPSKFTLSVPYAAGRVPLSGKSREARRVLLSDINFTSMVPELSRSADHLYRNEELVRGSFGPCAMDYKKSSESGWGGKTPDAGKHGSRSSWESKCQASEISIAGEEVRRRHPCRIPVPCIHARHSWSSVPSFKCHPAQHAPHPEDSWTGKIKKKFTEHHCCPSRQSLPDLRTDCDSGESTDSLIEEAEEFLRQSIDNMIIPKTNRKIIDRRRSEADSVFCFEPPKWARPFLPKTPNDLKEDHLVKVIADDGRIVMGLVRYSGEVIGRQEPYVGVEVRSDCGGCDGTFLERRYFQCKPNRAIFVPFKKVVLAWCT